MSSRIIGLLAVAATLVLSAVVLAQTPLGTAFTYQGQLKKDGSAYSGSCDMNFKLYDAATNGNQVGGVQTASGASVSNGLFNATLDFGAAFTGSKRWLEVQARCPAGSGGYITLAPRQELTVTPNAVFSHFAGLAGSAVNIPWTGLTGVPAGFADSVDNDTLYTAGTGLSLSGT